MKKIKTIKKIMAAITVATAMSVGAFAEGSCITFGLSFPPQTLHTIKNHEEIKLVDGMGFDIHVTKMFDDFIGLHTGVQILYATPNTQDVSDINLKGKNGVVVQAQVGEAFRVVSNRLFDITAAPGITAMTWLPVDKSEISPIFRAGLSADASASLKVGEKSAITAGMLWNWYICDIVNGDVNWFDKFSLGMTARVGFSYYL